MQTFTALLRREWLEHRVAFLWAPLALAAALILLGGMATALNLGRLAERATGPAEDMHWPSLFAGIAAPFALLYLLATTSVVLSSLFEERRDRSVLFWKSQPVSDLATLLSKLTAPLVLAPLALLGCILLTQLVALVYVAIGCHCDSGDGDLYGLKALLLSIPQWSIGLFVQQLWTLPLWCWLLLVSAAAPRAPGLWAFGLPLLLAFTEWLVFDHARLAGFLFTYLEPVGLLPYVQLLRVGEGETVTIARIVEPLGRWELWVGLVLAALLFAATHNARRRNGEF